MSILNKNGQGDTITEGWRALNLFTDRCEAVRLFSSYLNDDPPSERILFFYGDGGNGKTLLFRFLREHCCKRLRPEDWQHVKDTGDEEFIAHVKDAADAEPVPSGLIDFADQPRGEDRPQEAFSALLMLRRDLARHGLCGSFPLYDYACVWYLHKTGRLTGERLRGLFPAEEMDMLTELANAASGTSWGAMGKAFLNIFAKHSRERFTLYMQRREVDDLQVEEIERMDPERELVGRLPVLFAKDLNTAMHSEGAPKRIVLFFDTHEAFWGSQRNLSSDLSFQRDEWLRLLLGGLDFASGIVAVLAGRDRPRWPEASRVPIPEEFIETQHVGHLSEADADDYLQRAGIANAAVREAVVAYARVEPEQVHPLYLGMCADVVLAANEKGTPLTPDDFRQMPQVARKESELIDRLLRYVDGDLGYAVRALSASRAFNREIYFKLGESLNFQATEPAFEVLMRFSFVWEAEQQGEGRYRIHALLRRLSHERKDEVTRRADELLELFYREPGQASDTAAAAEAIYHANRSDWERGVREWVDVFDEATEVSRYRLCHALLDVRGEMVIESQFHCARVSHSVGDYYASLALHEQAQLEYLEAITAYDAALRLAPDDAASYNNKGLALVRLGAVQADLSQYDAAIASYARSIIACDAALHIEPDHVLANSNKSAALLKLGEVHAGLAQHEEAMASYAQAINACDAALRLAPDLATAHVNKGLALLRLGELQAALAQHEEAMATYAQAINACDAAIDVAPDLVMALSNKGGAFLALGEVQAGLSQYEAAMATYAQAIAALDAALHVAPDLVVVQSNKGLALLRLGEVQAALAQQEEAIATYNKAISAFDSALHLAPNSVMSHSNKGGALLRLGEVQAGLSQYETAMASYAQAINAFDATLHLAPDLVMAHSNKGLALASLGDVQAGLSHYDAAMATYAHAINAFEGALHLAPDLAMGHCNKALALTSLGGVQADLSQYEAAMATYVQAIDAADAALHLAPDLAMAHNNKALALSHLGELQAGLSQHEAAMASYLKAIDSADAVLRLAPHLAIAQSNRGLALLGLGALQGSLAQHESAMASYSQAIDSFDAALRLAPDLVMAHNNKGFAHAGLGDLQAELAQH